MQKAIAMIATSAPINRRFVLHALSFMALCLGAVGTTSAADPARLDERGLVAAVGKNQITVRIFLPGAPNAVAGRIVIIIKRQNVYYPFQVLADYPTRVVIHKVLAFLAAKPRVRI